MLLALWVTTLDNKMVGLNLSIVIRKFIHNEELIMETRGQFLLRFSDWLRRLREHHAI